MIKLMIVDDEQIVREGIKFILDHEFADLIRVVAMAKTGREAIEAFEEERPQIIVMDIQMPGINGIEAIKKIREINPNTKCIIISAYEQFEYAQQAVELAVNDYILKPINKAKFIEVIRKNIKEIEEGKANKKREIEVQEKLDQVLPILEYGYIYSILMNNDYQKETSDYHRLLNINKTHGYMLVIELGDGRAPTNLENKIGTGIKNNIQYEKIRNAIKYKCKAIVGPLIVNRIVVLIYEDLPENEYENRVKSIELAESIYESLVGISGSEVFIGIGSCHKVHRLNTSYNEAIKAIGKMTGEKVLHIKDAINNSKTERIYNFEKIKSDEDAILRKIEEGNSEEVEVRMRELFDRISKYYSDDGEAIKNIAIELMILINMTAYRNGLQMFDNNALYYTEKMKQLDQYYDLQNWCITRAREITLAIHEEKENKVSSAITEAMTYIDKHYNQDLRLKDVAEKVAISPQYFSKVFKEELGINFIDYLTNVRMEQAKKMLRDNNVSIKEICFLIGYNDPNYFSRLFKKVVGISPTEFV